MYISTQAILTVQIYTVTVAHQFIILLISCWLLFFSLFSMLNKLSNFSPYLLLFPQMHTNTPIHKHIHTDKSIQRYTCSKKKTHRNTNTPTHKQTQTDKQQRDRSLLIGTIDAWSGMIGARGSCLIGARGSHLVEARGYGFCLIGMIGAWLEQSKLVGLAWSKLMGLAWLELVGMGLALLEPN